MVVLKVLLPLLFLFFSFGELGRIRFSNAIGFGIIDLVIFSIFIYWLIFLKKSKYFLAKPILLFTSAALLSLAINFNNFENSQIFISSLYLMRFVLYSSIYFVFKDLSKNFTEKTIKYMIISGLGITFVGLLQFLIFPSLKRFYSLGWDEHMYRLFSTFLDPNFAGVILVLFFVFYFIAGKKITRSKHLYYGILTFIFIAIILTFSRGAILMFISSAFVYSLITKQWKIILGVLVLFLSIFIFLSPWFYIENTNLLRTFSSKERLKTSENAIKIFNKNPMGVGFNTYRYAREKYGDIDRGKFGLSHAGAGVDNSFILVLVTSGIPGLIAYFYMIYKMFNLGLAKIKSPISLIFIVSLSGLVVNALFINSLFYSFVMIWIWMLAGFTERN